MTLPQSPEDVESSGSDWVAFAEALRSPRQNSLALTAYDHATARLTDELFARLDPSSGPANGACQAALEVWGQLLRVQGEADARACGGDPGEALPGYEQYRTGGRLIKDAANCLGLGAAAYPRMPRDELCRWLLKPAVAALPAPGTEFTKATASAMLPYRLLEPLRDPDRACALRDALGGFLVDFKQAKRDWRRLDPDRFKLRLADAHVILQDAQDRLDEDLEALFLEPLRTYLGTLATESATTGLGSAGHARLTVLSGTEGKLTGTAVSSYDVTPPLDLKSVLTDAAGLQSALTGALPTPGAGTAATAATEDRLAKAVRLQAVNDVVPDAVTVAQVLSSQVSGLSASAAGTPGALLLAGTLGQVTLGLQVLQTLGYVAAAAGDAVVPILAPAQPGTPAVPGVVSLVSALTGTFQGLPIDRLLSIPLAALAQPTVWEALTSGAEMTVTPSVLTGGSSAELGIQLTVKHEPETGDGARLGKMISRVAKHEANTRVYVDSLDLFALTSFQMTTSIPWRPQNRCEQFLDHVPILNWLVDRKPRAVHHESVILIQSTILPTGMDTATLMDIELESFRR